MYSEKRKRERIPKKNEVVLRPYSALQVSKLMAEVPTTMADVASDGLCVVADTELIPGARVRVTVKMEPMSITSVRARQFASDAEVMWTKSLHEEGPYKTGLRFVDTPRADREVWSDFVGKSRASLF